MYRQNGLQHTFLKLKEAGAPGDFPLVMANVAHKALLKGFAMIEPTWQAYAKIGDLTDFKTHNRAFLGEFSRWLKKEPGKPYMMGNVSENGYSIQLGTYGRTFMLLRETVINDDLGAFKDMPEKIGRAGAQTLAEQVTNILESNPNAYDGSPLFGTRNSVSNFSRSKPLTADATGIANLGEAITAIRNQKDLATGRKLGLTARYLVVPSELEFVANWLVTGQGLVGSTSAVSNIPDSIKRLKVVVDTNLTFTTRWYVTADPNDCPFVEVGFLGGQMNPEVFLNKSSAVRVGGGGVDDFGYDYDDLEMKGRLDWAIAPAMFQGIFGGNQ